MSGAEHQKARRIAMVIRQALLMIVAMIEKEFGITSKTGGRIRVEFVDEREDVRQEIPPTDPERLVLRVSEKAYFASRAIIRRVIAR